jgi:hypothetical protein
VLVALTFAPMDALAASTAPPPLYWKSIVLSWTTGRTFKDLGTGQVRNVAGAATLKIYVSSKGHIFSEKTAVGRKGGGGGRRHMKSATHVRQEVADSGENKEIREWRAEGRSLVGYKLFARGARRLVVDFDASFTTCTLNISFAKQAGSPTILQRGGMREIQSIEVRRQVAPFRPGIYSPSSAAHGAYGESPDDPIYWKYSTIKPIRDCARLPADWSPATMLNDSWSNVVG